MSVCDLCGKETNLFKAKIEGVELTVCRACGKFGQVFKPASTIKPALKKIIKIEEPEFMESVVSNFAKLIRNAREKQGLTIEEFSKKLNERESFVQKLEQGKLEPSIDTARKLENLLKIKLVEEIVEKMNVFKGKKSGPLTIGDLIKFK